MDKERTNYGIGGRGVGFVVRGNRKKKPGLIFPYILPKASIPAQHSNSVTGNPAILCITNIFAVSQLA